MFNCFRILILLGVVLSCASAFFLNWGGTSEPAQDKPQIHQYPVATFYQQRLLQSPQSFSVGANGEAQPIPIPAIPIQVPLQAQLSQASNVQNVQLVPCLCPVSPDVDYEKDPTIYLNQISKQSK